MDYAVRKPIAKMPGSPSKHVAAVTGDWVLTLASLREKARTLGFDACRITSAKAPMEARERLARWLAEGAHGDMAWMAETFERRVDPRKLMPDAKSVVMLGLNYGPSTDPRQALEPRDAGVISVYARHRDYHDVLKGKLKELAAFLVAAARPEKADVKVFVDTAPLLEKPLAARAGIGWQGKHTNLVSREFGSWLFLGAIVTNLELPPDQAESDHCGQCRACLDACPTAAFPAPYQLDARRCISYLTIEHGAQFPASFGPRWAIASMAATTALRSAHGTSSQAKGGKRNLRRAPTSTRRPWPNSPASTMRRSGPFSPAARSSGSAGRASCAM